MEYRILGPLEVLREGEPVDTGPHKQRSLLALLLIHANRVVPTDRILDELWGDEADGKENSLWVYVSRLRTALEPGLGDAGEAQILTTRDHGYALEVDESSIDAVAFERAVGRGQELLRTDAEEASTVLREALGVWRGSALQDFSYDDFARSEVTRLEELRLGATEDAIEAELRLGRSGELVSELEALWEKNPLRERPVGQLMLALYRAGRSAEALRSFERFRRTIGEELGIDPSPELRRLEEQILLHDSRLQLRTPRSIRTGVGGAVVNPFKGLRPFQEDDAADFFGRDRLVAEVVGRITGGERLVVLVGPSGSGKSSAVRAGLTPAIRKGAISGSDQWRVAHMLPGSYPLIELEAALLRSSIDAPETLGDILNGDDDRGLLRAALRVLPDDSSKLVLIIDQFEELFTLVEDETVRRRFIDQTVRALDDPHGRVIVVATLRSDFYSQPFEFPEFADRMASGIVNVVPLASDELEVAALGPAQASGVVVEPALLAELLTDVIGQPGGLPLFQYTLTELFDRRVGDVLSVDTYRSIGGVQGALTRRANELFDSLDPGEQEAAEQLLLRLVTVAEHDEWSRRRVHASEIVALDVDIVAMQR
ncbi:MAG: BTAD domain-containing putative transcriptional regulator, partial [Actinomycetota bacterium]